MGQYELNSIWLSLLVLNAPPQAIVYKVDGNDKDII